MWDGQETKNMMAFIYISIEKEKERGCTCNNQNNNLEINLCFIWTVYSLQASANHPVKENIHDSNQPETEIA